MLLCQKVTYSYVSYSKKKKKIPKEEQELHQVEGFTGSFTFKEL